MKPANLAWAVMGMVTLAATACSPRETPVAITIAPRQETAAPPSSPRPPLAVAAAPSLLPLDSVRDERFVQRGPRPSALLVTEVQGIESLLTATPRESPDRPTLIARLGLGYAELAQASRSEGGDGSSTRAQAAHAAAVKYHAQLVREYPKWCGSPARAEPMQPGTCGDEATYYLGLEAERAGQLDQARKAYLDVIMRFPDSRFVPATYLAFGEMFFVEALRDPTKWELAKQSYEETLKYPPPANHVYGYAQYRLAQVYDKLGDAPQAASHLERAAAHAARYGDRTGLAAAAEQLNGKLTLPLPPP